MQSAPNLTYWARIGVGTGKVLSLCKYIQGKKEEESIDV